MNKSRKEITHESIIGRTQAILLLGVFGIIIGAISGMTEIHVKRALYLLCGISLMIITTSSIHNEMYFSTRMLTYGRKITPTKDPIKFRMIIIVSYLASIYLIYLAT